jgi:prevent-host-death family protein
MAIANIHEAKSQLSKLVEQAINGEEVTIAKEGRPMVWLVPIPTDSSPRHGLQWKGRVRIADDLGKFAPGAGAPLYAEGESRNQPLRWHADSEGFPAFQGWPSSPSPSQLTIVMDRTSRTG